MKDLPPHIKNVLLICLAIAIVGGGLWYWSSRKLTEALEAKNELENNIAQLTLQNIFPSQENLKIIEHNKIAAQETVNALKPYVDKQEQLYSDLRVEKAPLEGAKPVGGKPPPPTIEGLEPNEWKRIYTETLAELREIAQKNNVAIPDNFTFSLGRYLIRVPEQQETLVLGKQLLAVRELSKKLLEARITEIVHIKRAAAEDQLRGAMTPGHVPNEPDLIPGMLFNGPMGIEGGDLYTVLPFEVAFRCKPEALRDAVNKIVASPFIFVIRSINVVNGPETGEVQFDPKSKIMDRTETAKSDGKVMLIVSGAEQLKVAMRVDCIAWGRDLIKTVADSLPKASRPGAGGAERPADRRRGRGRNNP
jgi:hypothetical protein